MSEQADGHLNALSSYNFHRERLSLYANDLIRSPKFQAWTREHMYRSSYAHHHSPVHLYLLRIQCSQNLATFLVILASSPRTGLKVCSPKHSQT